MGNNKRYYTVGDSPRDPDRKLVRESWWIKYNKYKPHQGLQECERRRKQIGNNT